MLKALNRSLHVYMFMRGPQSLDERVVACCNVFGLAHWALTVEFLRCIYC